jgi:NitT/TauT family transport system permease protein
MATRFGAADLEPGELMLLKLPDRRGGAALRQRVYEKRHWALSVLLLVVFLGVWHAISANGLVHEIILPAPLSILKVFPSVVGRPVFLRHFVTTLTEIFGGFAIGVSFGLALGILFSLSTTTRRVLYPYVLGFQATPRVVFAPLLIAWFGFGPESKIAQATIGCFFPVFLNTLVGLFLVDYDAIKLMRSLRASRWQTFTKLRFPNALPMILAGVKVSLTFAAIGAIVSEFIGAQYGLGYEVERYHVEIAIPQMYAVIVVVGLLGIALYLLVEWLDHKMVFWRTEDVVRSKLR